MQARFITLLCLGLQFCLSPNAFGSEAELIDKESLSCTKLLQGAPTSKDAIDVQSQIEILTLSSSPRLFGPKKSNFQLKLRVGEKSVQYSTRIDSDTDSANEVHKNAEAKRLMNLTSQYREHIQNQQVLINELENFHQLNSMLLAPSQEQIVLIEEGSSILGQFGAEVLDLDIKIGQKHNQILYKGLSEIDPESLGELLLLLTHSKDQLMFALRNLSDIQLRYRLLEVQIALNENPELHQSEFGKELAKFLKDDVSHILSLLLEGPDRASMPWTIALRAPEDRLITVLIYEILANRPQKLEFVEIFSAPEPEDED